MAVTGDKISDIKTQTIAHFANPTFAINFAVDNNPRGIIKKLSDMGYGEIFTGNLSTDKVLAKQLLQLWYNQKNSTDIMDVLNSVNYKDDDSESLPYTRGFIDYFRENTLPQGVTENAYNRVDQDGMRFSWDGLLSALGAGLTTYGAVAGLGTTNGQPTPAQLQAQEAEKKLKMWTTIAWIVGILAFIALCIALYKYFSKK